MTRDTDSIPELARRIRIRVLRMIHNAGSSHLGSNLSMADLVAVLYRRILRITPAAPDDPERDRLILSKGHACAAHYAALAESGFFPIDWLDSFYLDGARLPGHATRGVPGIEVSTGALGHGLPLACGIALAGKRDAQPYRVFTLMSDGECDEGATWEAAMLAAHHQLDNLIAIIDYNKIQAMGHTRDVLELEPFADKWTAFGWAVREIDGHDVAVIEQTLRGVPFEEDRPSCVIAHTIKGKGVSFMEDQLLWHYRNPQGAEYDDALAELEAGS